MRSLRIGAVERREHALIFLGAVRRRECELIEIMRQRGLAVEILLQPPPPDRREIERVDESGEQREVAHADLGRLHAILFGRFEPERQHFGVGRRLVLAAETLDADLQEFGRGAIAMTKHRAEIAEAGGLAGVRRRQIIARYRDRQIGPQAQFAAVGIGGQKHAAADVLAAEIEKRFGRLQHRRRNPHIRIVGAARIGRDERFRPRVGLAPGRIGWIAQHRHHSCGGPLAWRASLFDEDRRSPLTPANSMVSDA